MKAIMSLLGLSMWVAMVSSQETKSVAPKRHYCGRGLTSALQLFCNGIYNTVESMFTLSMTPEEKDVTRSVSRRRAHMMAFIRRKRRGVYDECCRKGCSIEELTSYCGVT